MGSLHDRACQVFYELIGSRVDYGECHSICHKHDRYGPVFEGKHKYWSKSNPVLIVGHSFGGNTALVLQHYLDVCVFADHPNTSSDWISGIVTVNSPLNGALRTYDKGLHHNLPPIVKWLLYGAV